MMIENPEIDTLVPLLGTFNVVLGRVPILDMISFKIDWTKGGEGQEILREHFRSSSHGRIELNGKQYQGAFTDLGGFNTNDGLVLLGSK